MSKNIEMNYKISDGYEVLYPNILLTNVIDWNTSIYSKSEIDSKISTINDDINNAQMNPGGWSVIGTFKLGTGRVSNSSYVEVGNEYISIPMTLSIQNEYWISYQSQVNFVTNSTSYESLDFSLMLKSQNEFELRSDDVLGVNGQIKTLNMNEVVSIRPCKIRGEVIFQISTGIVGGYYDGDQQDYLTVNSSNSLQIKGHYYSSVDTSTTLNVLKSEVSIYSRKINSIT